MAISDVENRKIKRPNEYKEYEYNSIYIIWNKINNKVYVGSSVNPVGRIKNHMLNLRNGKSHKKLQSDFDKYGEDAFESEVLETNPIKNVNPQRREDFYIGKYNSIKEGYNTRNAVPLGSNGVNATLTNEIYNMIKEICHTENRTKQQWIKEAIYEKLERDGHL